VFGTDQVERCYSGVYSNIFIVVFGNKMVQFYIDYQEKSVPGVAYI